MAEVPSEACQCKIFLKVISELVYSSNEFFSIFIACHYEGIIVGVHLISGVVAQLRQVLRVLLHAISDAIIVVVVLLLQLLQLPYGCLEICKLTRSSYRHVLSDLFDSSHLLELYMSQYMVLRVDPYDRASLQAMITP